MTARTDVIVGLVFSKYDEVAGPEAFYWVPGELKKETLTVVSGRSLNMLAGDEHVVPPELEIVTFPPIEQKGMIKFLQIPDMTKRGGFVNASITLVFNDKDASIFYKYRADFKKPFDEFTKVVIDLEQRQVSPRDYLESFTRFYGRINEILRALFEKEVGLKDMVEFPEVDEGIKYRTYKFKVIVVGNPEVGKTSLILRFTDNAFRRTYITTIGVNVTAKNLTYSDRKVKFALWDLAGQTKYQLTRRHFYEGAQGIILVFDLTRPDSFDDIAKWHDDIKQTVKKDLPGIILGNKADIASGTARIPSDKVEAMAQRLGLGYIETSALEGKNVNEAFLYLAAMLVNQGTEETDEDVD